MLYYFHTQVQIELYGLHFNFTEEFVILLGVDIVDRNMAKHRPQGLNVHSIAGPRHLSVGGGTHGQPQFELHAQAVGVAGVDTSVSLPARKPRQPSL